MTRGWVISSLPHATTQRCEGRMRSRPMEKSSSRAGSTEQVPQCTGMFTATRRRSGRGLLTNLLNPKVGVFSLSFLPQFVPADVPAASFMFLLACRHAVLGCMWFGALIAATASLGGFVRRRGVVRWLDRLTAVVFVGFGLRLAVSATG